MVGIDGCEHEDGELLQAWADGSRVAADTLIERHFSRLYRFVELSAPGAAEDLVQEILLASVESRHRFRGEGSFVSFLLGIARRKVLMYWRTHSRRPPSVPVEEVSLQALHASPSSVLGRAETTRWLLAALRQIPLDAQMLVQMHYWDGLRGPALADALALPEGTVRSRLRRAKRQLRDAMDRQRSGLHTAA